MAEIRHESDRSVLIVEDDETTGQAYQQVLQRSAWRCALAPNLRTAKLLLGTRRFDAALLDLVLPDGIGFGLIRCVLEHNCDARVVVLTGAGGTETGARATSEGAHLVLDKPLGAADLRRAMDGEEVTHVDLDSIPTIDWIEYQHTKRVYEQLGCNVSHTAEALGRSRNWVKKTLAYGAPLR